MFTKKYLIQTDHGHKIEIDKIKDVKNDCKNRGNNLKEIREIEERKEHQKKTAAAAKKKAKEERKEAAASDSASAAEKKDHNQGCNS